MLIGRCIAGTIIIGPLLMRDGTATPAGDIAGTAIPATDMDGMALPDITAMADRVFSALAPGLSGRDSAQERDCWAQACSAYSNLGSASASRRNS